MRVGAKIHRVKTCSSTNDLAKELALGGDEEGTVVIADEQTQGRGTRGRSWCSPKKMGIYASIIFRPPHSKISLLPLVAGLAVAEAVSKSTGIKVKLKWPNDLVWRTKKLGGILCESGFLGNQLSFVICGIGLNVMHSRSDFPRDIQRQAVSLKLITKKDIDSEKILQELWPALDGWYNLFLKEDHKKIALSFEEHSVLSLGDKTTVKSEGREFAGLYAGVDFQGRLILERGTERIYFSSAEIVSTNKGG